MSIHPSTELIWASEHGPMGGDELNVIRKTANYGWPAASYGLNYNGAPVTDKTRDEGIQQPSLFYRPSIAVAGIEFVSGDEFPLWEGKLLVGALKYEEVILNTIADDRVIHQETILKNAGRVRDIGVDPSGAVYIVTEQPGRIWRLTQIRERVYK
jgi:glucose/arabinose dehydrogenase